MNKPVFDPIVQAVSGLATVQAGSDTLRPRLVRTILPDKLTGIQAAQAITAALLARERTGRGQHVRLSMLDTVVSFLWSSDMGAHTFVGAESASEPAQSRIDLIYETGDGHITVAVNQDKEWVGFARAAERPDLLEDERFRTAESRQTFRDERLELIQSVLAQPGVCGRVPGLQRRGSHGGCTAVRRVAARRTGSPVCFAGCREPGLSRTRGSGNAWSPAPRMNWAAYHPCSDPEALSL